MPAVGFWCPVHRAKVPFDHFDVCQTLLNETRPAVSPFVASAVAKKITEDVRHRDLALTATSVSNCPRQVFIERLFPYYTDPSKQTASTRGTALHAKFIADLDPEVYITEVNDPMRAELHGTLWGMPVSAKLDVIKAPRGADGRRRIVEIIDAKFPKDWSVTYRRKKGGKADVGYVVQLNIARLLLAQQAWIGEFEYDPNNVLLTVWDHAIGNTDAPEPLDASGVKPGSPMLTEEQVGALKSWDSLSTTKENAEYLWAAKNALEQRPDDTPPGEWMERVGASLPLFGREMFNRKKCDGCEVKPICDGLLVKFGEPQL